MDGFEIGYARVRSLDAAWADSARVVRDLPARIAAPGSWSPGLADAVAQFVDTWATDLGELADHGTDIRNRLDRTVEAYRTTDARVAKQLRTLAERGRS